MPPRVNNSGTTILLSYHRSGWFLRLDFRAAVRLAKWGNSTISTVGGDSMNLKFSMNLVNIGSSAPWSTWPIVPTLTTTSGGSQYLTGTGIRLVHLMTLSRTTDVVVLVGLITLRRAAHFRGSLFPRGARTGCTACCAKYDACPCQCCGLHARLQPDVSALPRVSNRMASTTTQNPSINGYNK